VRRRARPDARRSAGIAVAGGVRRSALALLTATVLVVAASAALAAGSDRHPAPQQGPLPVPGKPSIPAGEAVYAAHCARCHDQVGRFAGRDWRAGRTPAWVTRVSLGMTAGHPAALSELEPAWEVTGYLWTLPDDGSDIRKGEGLALEANDALRSDAVGLVLFHWNELQNLKNGGWVLNHTEADVDGLMRHLAGSKYTALSAKDRQDLIDYTFASFFEWPSAW